MIFHPAVIVHSLRDANLALAPGLPVTLLSAPGAALYAGCLWWRELVAIARASHPNMQAADILDCANASGAALGALRSGVTRLVLTADAPGWSSVAAIAESQRGCVLRQPPAALDLAQRNATRHLRAWLSAANA